MTSQVSVVIPTRNRATLLGRAIESVLNQEGVDLEVIVVDDCSSDETPAVLEGFGDRLRVLRTEANVERAAARNLGARTATSPYLAFLDSDDEWTPGKLLAQMPYLEKGQPSVTGLSYIDEGHREIGHRYVPPADAERRIRFENPYLGTPSSLALPASLFRGLGGFPEERDLQGSEDWLFLIRLISRVGALPVIPEPLIQYRLHSANATRNPQSVARSMWSAVGWIERQEPLADAHRRRLRARTAGAIAREFATNRGWRGLERWAGRMVRAGDPIEALRWAPRIGLSAARAVVFRRRRL